MHISNSFLSKNLNLNIGISSLKIKFNRHKQIHKYLILDMLLNMLSVFILKLFISCGTQKNEFG